MEKSAEAMMIQGIPSSWLSEQGGLSVCHVTCGSELVSIGTVAFTLAALRLPAFCRATYSLLPPRALRLLLAGVGVAWPEADNLWR